MPNEGPDKEFDLIRLYTDLENELAANRLNSQDPIIQRTVKMCVFHIILKAIALSKDPKADKRAVLALYESAKEIIVNSTLEEDESTHNRLQDLINSIIDGEDISAQLRSYTHTNRQWLDSKVLRLENKMDIINQKSSAMDILLKEINSKINLGTIRRTPNLMLIAGTGFFAILFTIITSVAIISFLLTSAINNEGALSEQKQQMQLQQQHER